MWDRQLGCWTKDNLAADLSRSRLTPSPPLLDHSTITLPSSSSLDSIEYNLRTEVSDVSSYYNPASYGRPISQMSYKSEDLKTIPSEDVSVVVLVCTCIEQSYFLLLCIQFFFFCNVKVIVCFVARYMYKLLGKGHCTLGV